jgi:4,5-DOPA dioxygenase extradiol
VGTLPVIFVSHGAPTFALEPGQLGPQLTEVGTHLSDVQAILVVSAHWQSPEVRIMASAAPETIHDFGGFAPELYRIRYPAPGAPQMARRAQQLLTDAGFTAELDKERGLDHGAWVPLRYLSPAAKLPVFQVSLPLSLHAAGALRMGVALAPLRVAGTLIVGSGSLTHNLGEVFRGTQDVQYAKDFVAWIRSALERGDRRSLVHYRAEAPHAARAHPTEEHFLPLLVAFGASAPSDALRILDGGLTYGVLSMEAYVWNG